MSALPCYHQSSARVRISCLVCCCLAGEEITQDSKTIIEPGDGGPSEEFTLHNCDGGDFVVGESGNGELQQLLVHAEGWALLCLEQLDRSHRNS